MRISKKRVCCFYFFSILLAACSDDNEDLVNYINEVKQRKTREIKSLPSFTPLPFFKFPDDGNRRSPFLPMIFPKKMVDVNGPDQQRPKQPLEAYPLDALLFVGTLQQGNEIWALIQLPNSRVTSVRIGSYMGQSYGRIVSIKNDSIELIEMTQRSSKWEKHRTKIELYTGK